MKKLVIIFSFTVVFLWGTSWWLLTESNMQEDTAPVRDHSTGKRSEIPYINTSALTMGDRLITDQRALANESDTESVRENRRISIDFLLSALDIE
ncbi:hypothetical protein [Sediminibacillus albus]|uniref:hypothetical protein n=1 Tax=Sediminibacillus albus TaxID=407036 RepID=UPI000B8177DA|nr:hypothetical protein [Sediminibacillus albus]